MGGDEDVQEDPYSNLLSPQGRAFNGMIKDPTSFEDPDQFIEDPGQLRGFTL